MSDSVLADLTSRQKKILKAIIEEHVQTAQAIGSETLEKKYNLGVSPATLRTEMVRLTKAGYLTQPHTSAGRSPTALGFRLYINELMDEKKLSVRDEVSLKEKLWNDRYEMDKLLRDTARALAEQTRTLGVALTDEGDVYYAGTSNILDMPEFYDIDVTKTVLSLLDRCESLNEIFARAQTDEPIHILFGRELDWQFLEPTSFIFTHFESGHGKSGAIGVIGPARLNYASVIPTVRYLGNLISEAMRSW